MKSICLLGSTGSIGQSTLDVITDNSHLFEVSVLTAHKNVDLMIQQCLKFQPKVVAMADSGCAEKLQKHLMSKSLDIEVFAGKEGLIQAVQSVDYDYVMAAIVGAAGLLPTLSAIKSGRRVLLANKEALVMSGQLFMQAIAENNAELLPIDSEHNAIFQCMSENSINKSGCDSGIEKIILTGSGGPFLNKERNYLNNVTPEQACNHPNWSMGQKISVDSATMMNKGLEAIEANWLFSTPFEKIDVVIHPQSIIHSMVSYKDGSVLAQLGQPDMKTPIAHALAWPDRINSGVASLDFFNLSQLTFQPPDATFFPCLKLAYEAGKQGGTCPAILNAANEVAVEAFLEKQIKFTEIAETIEKVLHKVPSGKAESLEKIIEDDLAARQNANQILGLS
ncbi:MAG: 1-deoxy-D-xylulose-5-phosphate reductoisomerase [Methylococcales bacterium]|nr:1-deoxy-D-xylulose-5-phosphate reductoisomerase [Methylococcales bacterium]